MFASNVFWTHTHTQENKQTTAWCCSKSVQILVFGFLENQNLRRHVDAPCMLSSLHPSAKKMAKQPRSHLLQQLFADQSNLCIEVTPTSDSLPSPADWKGHKTFPFTRACVHVSIADIGEDLHARHGFVDYTSLIEACRDKERGKLQGVWRVWRLRAHDGVQECRLIVALVVALLLCCSINFVLSRWLCVFLSIVTGIRPCITTAQHITTSKVCSKQTECETVHNPAR